MLWKKCNCSEKEEKPEKGIETPLLQRIQTYLRGLEEGKARKRDWNDTPLLARGRRYRSNRGNEGGRFCVLGKIRVR